MPPNLQIAALVLGAVFLLVAILGGRFKIFTAEVTGTASRAGRSIAGVVGIAIIAVSLVSLVKPADERPTEETRVVEPRPEHSREQSGLAGKWAREVEGDSWVIEPKPNGEYSIVVLFGDGEVIGEGTGALNENERVFSFTVVERRRRQGEDPDEPRFEIRGDLRFEGDNLSGPATVRNLQGREEPVLAGPMTLHRIQ